MLYLLFIPWVILQSGGQVNVYVQKLKARQPHWYRTKTRRASALGENTFFVVCVAPNPDPSLLAAPSNVLLPSNPNNVRLSSTHNCPSDMRTGFVLDWKIWMGCLQSSVILHKQKQIKTQRGRTEHARWFDFFHVFGCIKLQKVPQLSWVSRSDGCRLYESTIWTSSCLFLCRLLWTMTRTRVWWIPGVLDPPLGQTSVPEATVLIQTASSPDMPLRCPRASLGMPPFCFSRGEGGGGWWSPRLRLIIRPIYTWHQTVRRAASHRSDTNCAHWGCRALSFRRVFSRTVTCSSGRSCDPVVRTNRVAQFVLGRAKGRGGEKTFSLCDF